MSAFFKKSSCLLLSVACLIAIPTTGADAYSYDGVLTKYSVKDQASSQNQQPLTRVAWAWILGTAARGAVAGTAARAAVGVGAGAMMMSRGAVAAPRVVPYAVRPPTTYNYRPYYYQPRYQPRFAPSVYIQAPRPTDYGYNSYANGYQAYAQSGSYNGYGAPQRQCWTTSIEAIPTYGGRIIRRHYQCAYR